MYNSSIMYSIIPPLVKGSHSDSDSSYESDSINGTYTKMPHLVLRNNSDSRLGDDSSPNEVSRDSREFIIQEYDSSVNKNRRYARPSKEGQY